MTFDGEEADVTSVMFAGEQKETEITSLAEYVPTADWALPQVFTIDGKKKGTTLYFFNKTAPIFTADTSVRIKGNMIVGGVETAIDETLSVYEGKAVEVGVRPARFTIIDGVGANEGMAASNDKYVTVSIDTDYYDVESDNWTELRIDSIETV